MLKLHVQITFADNSIVNYYDIKGKTVTEIKAKAMKKAAREFRNASVKEANLTQG